MDKEEYWQKIEDAIKDPKNWKAKLNALELPKEYSDQIDLAHEPEAYLNEDLPLWVRNLSEKLSNSVYNSVKFLLDADPQDYYASGFAIGLAHQIKNSLLKKLPELSKLTGIEFNDEDRVEIDDEFIEIRDKLSKDSEMSTASIEDFSQYHRGLSEGALALIDENGQLKEAKEDTEIVRRMLILWPIIEDRIKTRRQMYNYLLRIMGKQLTGSYERVEKFLERIEFSPAKPGRPKKANDR